MYARLDFASGRITTVLDYDIDRGIVSLGWQKPSNGKLSFVWEIYSDTKSISLIRKGLKMLADNKIDIFFDYYGQPWKACGPTEQDVQEFGPAGYARPLTKKEMVRHKIYTDYPGEKPIDLAKGRLVPFHGWDLLIT